MQKPAIGWIGLGNMGKPIATNVLNAGYALTIYNRTPGKAGELVAAGATQANSIADVVSTSDMVFTMVSDDAAVNEIYMGAGGLVKNNLRGKIAVDMSTVSPATSRTIADACKNAGCSFLDAPVSGSVKPAQERTLIILVGGDPHTFQQVQPLFATMGKRVLHLGANGAGSAAKLAINYLLGLNLQGLAETVLFAQRNGIAVTDMLTIINEGAVGNGITKLKSANILNGDYTAAFALKHLAKDLRLAGEQGLESPLFQPLNRSFQQALSNGLGDEDVMAIYKFLSQSDSKSLEE